MTTQMAYPVAKGFRICRLVFLALWALSLAPCWVDAQNVDFPISQGNFVPPVPSCLETQPANPTAAAIPITVRGPCDPDYWIVSTRNANCQVENGQAVNYEVFRFDGSNQGRCSSIEELLSSLQPTVPVCLMAHGSFVTWESMLNDCAGTYRWLREAAPCQPLHVVFFTWASNDGELLPHLQIKKYGVRSALNGFYLADVVSKISLDHPISLIGHSHGTRLVTACLHSMAGGEIEGKFLATGPQPGRRLRVVLAAAAIDHDWLNPSEKYGLAICPEEGILNLRNRLDLPLQFYPLNRPFSKRSMAITGVTRRDRKKLGEWSSKVIDYDVSHLVGSGHLWATYYKQPVIATAIRHYVYFDECQSATAITY